jgi:hypothetical protein
MLFTLARETGWSEPFILWELPLSRALQYHHCTLRASLAWTVAPTDTSSLAEQAQSIHTLASRLPPAKDDVDD